MTDSSPEEKYERFTKRNTVHYGQVKLLMADIFFILHFVDFREHPNPILLAIGAAPGHHYPILQKLFPMIEFHLYDPRPFCLRIAKNTLNIHSQYFTNEDANSWKMRSKRGLYVTSDIRSVDHTTTDSKEELTKAIIDDMSIQKEWIEIMNPNNAALKTKFPYIDDGEEDVVVEYLNGYLCKQQFAPQTSTESRLIPVKEKNEYYTKKWSSRKYHDQFFYFNKRIRHSNFNNPFTGKSSDPIYGDDLTNDYDSIATSFILAQYLNKMSGIEDPTSEDVKKLFRICMCGINEQRNIPLHISMLRNSFWKSSTLPRTDKELASKIREGWLDVVRG